MTDSRRPLVNLSETTLRLMAEQAAETYNQALLKRAAMLELKARGYVIADEEETQEVPRVQDDGLEWIE